MVEVVENIIVLNISKPIDLVFAFTINPQNTPRWMPHILEETADPYPTRIGTIYSQIVKQDGGIATSNYKVSQYKENELFEIESIEDSPFPVTAIYTYKESGMGTILTYKELLGSIEKPANLTKSEITEMRENLSNAFDRLKQLLMEG